MAAKVYTKQGDQGKTSLIGGDKVSKSETRLHAYGTIDELNSMVGVVRAHLQRDPQNWTERLDCEFEKLQNWLFDLGSLLASTADNVKKFGLKEIEKAQTETLEKHIDEWTKELKPLKNFILPGGTELAAHLHVCRTISRRAERYVVEVDGLPEQVVPFVNRLSDYFFVAARWCNFKAGVADVLWKKS